jgi:endonuclease G
MASYKAAFIAFVALIGLGAVANAEVRRFNYDGFSVWVDCQKRGAVLFHYFATQDRGSLSRISAFSIDPDAGGCQQTSTDTYQSVLGNNGLFYDLGHQVPANHLDGSAVAIRQSNYMTNILPQTASMNRGAWRQTEDIIECVRDVVSLEVWGGPIWGSKRDNDFFVKSHGVRTPDDFWKVVIRTDNRRAIGWIIPNDEAPPNSLNKWIRSIDDIERATGLTFNARNKSERPQKSWAKPKGCSTK